MDYRVFGGGKLTHVIAAVIVWLSFRTKVFLLPVIRLQPVKLRPEVNAAKLQVFGHLLKLLRGLM
jgi:hypothetical protein